MLLVNMPRSSSSDKGKLRELFFSADTVARLNERKTQTDIPVAAQIRRAIERYVEVPSDAQHRLYVTKREERFPCTVSDELWNALKERKKETGLDLNEQVQIAVALYLQAETSPGAQSQSQADDLELTPPPSKPAKKIAPIDPEMEARLRRMVDDAVKENTMSLVEQLRAEGYDVKLAVPTLFQKTVRLPLQAIVSCGDGDELDNVVEPDGNGSMEEITGRLAAIATAHSFVALAKGLSMSNDDSEFDIRPGDKLMMTPLDEFPRAIKRGDVVLAEIEFKDGRKVRTLKFYAGTKLKANNPEFQGVDLGPKVKRAIVIAVCRGKLERIYG